MFVIKFFFSTHHNRYIRFTEGGFICLYYNTMNALPAGMVRDFTIPAACIHLYVVKFGVAPSDLQVLADAFACSGYLCTLITKTLVPIISYVQTWLLL